MQFEINRASINAIRGMLMDYPKEVILKDGAGVTLRPLRKGDEHALFRMYGRFSENDRWFLNEDVSDFKRIRQWVKGDDTENGQSVAAVLEGRIIAHACLFTNHYGARRHMGGIRISVDPEHREKNLGTWMLLDLINLAMERRLEMLVMRLVKGRDQHIMKSIRKLDFEELAVLKDYIRDRQGHPLDLVIMVKHLRMLTGRPESGPSGRPDPRALTT